MHRAVAARRQQELEDVADIVNGSFKEENIAFVFRGEEHRCRNEQVRIALHGKSIRRLWIERTKFTGKTHG